MDSYIAHRRKFKLIKIIILAVLGLIFPYSVTAVYDLSTAPEDFIKKLGDGDFERFGVVYSPKLLPEGYYIESVELVSEAESNEGAVYAVNAIFQNNEGQVIRYIQSKDDGFNQAFIQEQIVETDIVKEKHFYFREDTPENMVFWKNEDGLYIVYAADWTADDLRDLARDIAGNPIEYDEV